MSVGVRGRLLIQNCISASLQLNWDQIKNGTAEPEFAKIGSGLVVYVCFKKEADQTTVDKFVKILLEGALYLNDSYKTMFSKNLERSWKTRAYEQL